VCLIILLYDFFWYKQAPSHKLNMFRGFLVLKTQYFGSFGCCLSSIFTETGHIIQKRLAGTQRKPVLTNRRKITHGAVYANMAQLISLCCAALPPNGQLAYWYSGRLPVYTCRSAVRFLGILFRLSSFSILPFIRNIPLIQFNANLVIICICSSDFNPLYIRIEGRRT